MECKHTTSEINYWNKENEEGEYYFELWAECTNCKKVFETYGWGWIDTDDEALEVINSLMG